VSDAIEGPRPPVALGFHPRLSDDVPVRWKPARAVMGLVTPCAFCDTKERPSAVEVARPCLQKRANPKHFPVESGILDPTVGVCGRWISLLPFFRPVPLGESVLRQDHKLVVCFLEPRARARGKLGAWKAPKAVPFGSFPGTVRSTESAHGTAIPEPMITPPRVCRPRGGPIFFFPWFLPERDAIQARASRASRPAIRSSP